jgi:NAD+ synthase (glutamine-hydrolysing)
MLGWTTMFGDHAAHYGVNVGVPKTLVSFLIAWTADEMFRSEPAVQKVLRDILATEISPELLPHDGGKIAQRTEETIGPYELHDFFGYHFVRFGFSPARIARLALEAFAGKYTIGQIKQWLRVYLTRFFANQFKRSCLPDGPKVGSTCVSPRGDWRMPSDAEAQAWLRNLEMVPENCDQTAP